MASKSKRNRVKFKWTKELFFLIGFLVVLIVVTIVLAIPSRADRQLAEINEAITTYNTANETTYYPLSADNHISVLSHDDLVNKKNDSSYTIVWYGSLTDGSYLEQIYTLDQRVSASKNKVSQVYLYYNTFVEDAVKNETTDTLSYKNSLRAMEDQLNDGKNPDAEAIDLSKYPSIFVFKEGKLVYNSQIAGDSTEYVIAMQINKAFGYAVEE